MTREGAVKHIELFKRCETLGGAIEGALDMAIAALREQDHFREVTKKVGWISVEDEKPKRRGRYFIAYKFDGSDMRFYGEAMWHDDIPDNGHVQGDHFSNEGVGGMYVTHWMEIPKLPQAPEVEG